MTRTTVYMPLDEIRSAERNAKRHDRDEIMASLRRFGYADTAILDERTERLVGGHGRIEGLRALRDAGEDPPQYVALGADGKTWLVPVQRGWASTDDAQADAIGIALNRLTETGGWDAETLVGILDELLEADGRLLGVGFDEDALDDLIVQMQETTQGFNPDKGNDNRTTQRENDINERAERYAQSNLRSFVLDYPLSEYDVLDANCAFLRRHRGVDTNAQLVKILVDEAAAGLPEGQ